MTPRSANEKGALVPPSRVNAAVTDPAPIKVSRPVPRNSAPSFCTSVGSFSIVYLLPHGSQENSVTHQRVACEGGRYAPLFSGVVVRLVGALKRGMEPACV